MNYYSLFGRKRKFTIFDAILLGIIVFVSLCIYVMSPKQYIHCLKGVGCKVYYQDNTFSRKEVQYSFKQADIKDYKTEKIQKTHSRKSGLRRYYNVYRPIIILNDGAEIKLETFEFSSTVEIDKMLNDMVLKSNYKKNPQSLLQKWFL